MRRASGIIPYGSNDESIVLQISGKDSAEITSAGGVLQAGAVVTPDGVIAAIDGAVRFDLSAIVSAEKTLLQYCGQISFKVRGIDIGTPVGYMSNAPGYPSTSYFAQWNSVDSASGDAGRIMTLGATDTIRGQPNVTDASITKEIHEAVQNENGVVHVAMTWNGARSELFFNGSTQDFANTDFTRASYPTDQFNFLMLGARLGGTAGGVVGAVISDLVIASTPITWSTHQKLANLTFYGDSFLFYFTYLYYTYTPELIAGYFRMRGLECSYINRGTGGAYILNSGVTKIIDQIDGSDGGDAYNVINPRIVCYRGATNDARTLSDIPQTFIDLKGHINTIMSNSDHLIIGNCPSLDIRNGGPWAGSQPQIDWIDQWNATIAATGRGLIDWWNTNNPGRLGAIVLVDEFTQFGGHNPSDFKLFMTNDYHPGPWGHKLRADLYAREIEKVIGD